MSYGWLEVTRMIVLVNRLRFWFPYVCTNYCIISGLLSPGFWFMLSENYYINREHHFYNDKEHCGSIILAIEITSDIEDTRPVICICFQHVSDTRNQNFWFEALLVNDCLIVIIIFCFSIMYCGWCPRPATKFSTHRFSQCETITS